MRAISLLAMSFGFSAWGDRMWSFAIALYLIKLTPGSLQLAAIYGLVQTCVCILLSPMVGDWVDRTERLKTVKWSLLIQNILVILSAVCVMVLLYGYTDSKALLILLQVGVVVFGALATLIGQGEKIAITKDWVVVICSGDKAVLANVNACFRRIDLTVAILAPVLIGFLMSLVVTYASVILICAWNVVSFFGEYFLLYKVYHKCPELGEKFFMKEAKTFAEDEKPSEEEGESLLNKPQDESNSNSKNILKRTKSVIKGWSIYKNQEVMLAGISLALLYLTVLGFNAITSGFAYDQGLKEMYVSICFGLGSLFGIFGTFLFPILRSKIGLVKTGIVGFFLQISTLSLCVVSIWLPGSDNIIHASIDHQMSNKSSTFVSTDVTNTSADQTSVAANKDLTSILVFMGGVILSRSGLWIIDLTVTQLQQENVVESERGNVGGVQYALNSTFDLTHFVLTIVLSDPKQFCVLIIVSVTSVTVGLIVYSIFSCKFTENVSVDANGDAIKRGDYETI